MGYYLNTKSGLTGPVVEDKIRELFSNGRIKDETPLYDHAGEYLSSVSELLNAPPEPLADHSESVEAAFYLNTKSGLTGPVVEDKIRELHANGRINDETPLYDHTGEYLLSVSELLYKPAEPAAESAETAEAAFYLNSKNGLVGPVDSEKLLSLLLASKVQPETPVYDAAGTPCGAVSDYVWEQDPTPEEGAWEPAAEEAPAVQRPAAPKRGRSSNLPNRGATRPRTMPGARMKSRGKGGPSRLEPETLHIPINSFLSGFYQFCILLTVVWILGFVALGLTSEQAAKDGGQGLLILLGLAGLLVCFLAFTFERWVHRGVKVGSSGRLMFQKIRMILGCVSIVGALIALPAFLELKKAEAEFREREVP